MESFTTQVGQPSASLATFTVHGFSDEFLAARVRFLAAHERIYSTDAPSNEKQRKIRVPKPLFATFETLQHDFHQEQGWIIKNPDAEGGEEMKHTSFAVTQWEYQMTVKSDPDLRLESSRLDAGRDTWTELWSVKRKYNWWIPLASPSPEIHYTHDMMVSHGITLFWAVRAYGRSPIELNEAIQHIEHTSNLCISHIEQYWQLAQQAISDKDWEESKKMMQRQQQLEYCQMNMGICIQVERDVNKARLLAPDRVTRASRRVSTDMVSG
jgi:hypothetical protein